MTPVTPDTRHDDVIGAPRDVSSIAGRAHLACVLEASAPKPGNVSPGRPFTDMRYEDFLASADAIARPLVGVGQRPLGQTIVLAVAATAARTKANTNLGIVLLLTPLARAAVRLLPAAVAQDREERLSNLRAALERVLAETTVADARDVYRAIRLANPGGLGSADEQDVSTEPTVTLLEAMTLAADRDGIAREYATAYGTTFDMAVPALLQARADGLVLSEAIVETFLRLVAARPDTHIVRRGGDVLARRVSAMATDVLAAGGVRTDAGRRRVAELDLALRDPRNLANPGTSADLTAAALFAALIVGGWSTGPMGGAIGPAVSGHYDDRSEES